MSGRRRVERVWSESRLLIVLFVAAVGVRVGYTLLAGRVDPFLTADPLHGDAGSYDRIVRTLLATGEYGEFAGTSTAFWPPLYPFFLAALYSIFGYHFLVVRLAQALLGAVAVVATTLVASEIFDRRTALLVGLGMTFYPHLVYFGAWLIPEALYVSLLTVTVLVAIKLQKRPCWLGFAGLGLLLGLDTLAKPATLMLLPLLALWVIASLKTQPARRFGYLVLLGVFTVLSIAPWTVRNSLVFGSIVPVSTNGGYTFYGANNEQAFGGHREGFPPPLPGLSEPEADREYYRLGADWITRYPLDAARLAVAKLARLLSPLSVASYENDYPLPLAAVIRLVYAAFLTLACVGMVLSLPRWRDVFVLYVLVVRVLIGTVMFYGDARYTLPMVPALVIYASFAITFFRSRQLLSARDATGWEGTKHETG